MLLVEPVGHGAVEVRHCGLGTPFAAPAAADSAQSAVPLEEDFSRWRMCSLDRDMHADVGLSSLVMWQ
jgi:hypothetical protein